MSFKLRNTDFHYRSSNKGFVGNIINQASVDDLINNTTTSSNSINQYSYSSSSGAFQSTGYFESNNNNIPDITTFIFNNYNESKEEVSSWYNKIKNGVNTNDLILEIYDNTSQNIRGRYEIDNCNFLSGEGYKGFQFYYKRVWDDDPSINQLIIYKTTSTPSMYYSTDTDVDEFKLSNISNSDIIGYVSIYGQSQSTPATLTQLTNFFTSFIDNVITDGTNPVDINVMKSNFYNNYSTLASTLPPLYENFRVVQRNYTLYPNEASNNNLTAEVNIRYINENYTIVGINNSGNGYNIGDTLTFYGEYLNGTTPENNLIVTVTSVDSGNITGLTVTSGITNFLNLNYISDGGSDQYDTGNYLNTEFEQEFNYARGEIVEHTFGEGSKHFVGYKNSIFIMLATGNYSNEFYISGELGADGSGFVDAGIGSINQGPFIFETTYLTGSGLLSQDNTYSINIYPLVGSLNKNNNDDLYTLEKIGINTDEPIYPLHITSQFDDYSIFCSHRILSDGYDNISDERIKKNIVEIEQKESVELISKLKVKSYNKKSLLDTKEEYVGLIAQEVKTVSEKLVKNTTNFICNVNKYINVNKEDNSYSFILDNSYDINKDDILQVLIDNDITTIKIIDKISIENNNFKFIFNNKTIINNSIFINGKKVDDFLILNSDKIQMHLLNAVQRLIKENEELKSRITTLELK